MDQKTLKQFESILNKALANLVTKDDAKQFLTKDDAKQFLTKDDAKVFATKSDILLLRNELRATKEELIEEIQNVEIDVTVNSDNNKADKSVVEEIDTRITKIEQKLVH